MADSEEAGDDSSSPRTKVGRLIEDHDLVGIGEEMERRWTSDGDERMSLRDLATLFNRRLLDARLTDTGVQSLPGDVENTYRLLTDDGVGSAERTRLTRQLERDGLDPDALRDDFVTYQAVRSYLTEVRGAEYEREDDDRVADESSYIQRLRGRLTSVAEQKLERLRDTGCITLGDFNLFVDINVYCKECEQQFSTDELLTRRACECGTPTDSEDRN